MLIYRGKYDIYNVEIKAGQYEGGRLALTLFDTEDGIPVAIVTVNVPSVDLEKDEIIIKDYSENEGVLKFMKDNELAVDTGKTIPLGSIEFNIAKITDKLKDMIV